jgi:hypothetical protein
MAAWEDQLMGCIHWEFESNADQDPIVLARQVAERSCIEVLRRLSGLSSDMSNAEARGYIRTRSAVVVHREVNRLMHCERTLRTTECSRLIELATELLVDHFLTVDVVSDKERTAA